MGPARRLLLAGVLLAATGCALLQPPPVWEQPVPPVRDEPVLQPGMLERAQLGNGLEILVLEDPRLPRAQIGVAVRRGAGVVPSDEAGLSGFTAELMRRGAGGRDALELARATDELGARLSVASDWDSMVVQVAGLTRDLDPLLGILADVVLRPTFPADEARKVRSEMLAGLEQAVDDPATLGSWGLVRALYGDHPYGSPRDGRPETVVALEVADARALYEALFVPNDAILFAAGDVTLADLLPRVEKAFGAWPRGAPAPMGPAPPPRVPDQRRIVIVDRPDLGQARVLLGHEGIARTDPRRTAAQLMNTVLGAGGFSSRLVHSLRAESGLTYSAGSGFSLRRHPGPFYVSTFTRVPEVRRLLDLVFAELARMQSDPPDGEELANAKSLLVGNFSMSLETSAAVMSALVDLEIHGLPRDSLDTYRGRVRDVSAAAVAQLAAELLHPDRAAILLVGPAEALRPQVEDLGPVEVVTP